MPRSLNSRDFDRWLREQDIELTDHQRYLLDVIDQGKVTIRIGSRHNDKRAIVERWLRTGFTDMDNG